MNGSRLNQNPRGERSLDALNKTIDNLEARIEGLLKASGREPRIDKDLLNEIRQRQRSLGNERPNERGERTRDQRGDQPAHEQPRQRQDERDQQRRQETARSEESLRQEQRAPAHRAAHASLQENRNVYLPPSDRPAPRPSMQAQRQPEAPAMRSPARHPDERASERDYREPQAYREAPPSSGTASRGGPRNVVLRLTTRKSAVVIVRRLLLNIAWAILSVRCKCCVRI